MAKEEIRTDHEGTSLFLRATDLLSCAYDLLWQYSENANDKKDGENMLKVYGLLDESMKRFSEFEVRIYG